MDQSIRLPLQQIRKLFYGSIEYQHLGLRNHPYIHHPYHMVGPPPCQVRQRRLLLPRRKVHALVGCGPLTVCGQHFQHDIDRTGRICLQCGSGPVQLQSHRSGGPGLLRHIHTASLHKVRYLHHSGVSGEEI